MLQVIKQYGPSIITLVIGFAFIGGLAFFINVINGTIQIDGLTF